jgi:hypothetical protein
MSWWEALLDSVGAVAAVIAVPFVCLFLRRRWLSRSGGTFECSVRVNVPQKAKSVSVARGWILGLGRYSEDRLEWFRIFSFWPRPRQVFTRSMTVLGRRTPHGAEAFSLYAGHHVIEIRLDSGRRVEIAMSESALTGFLAWSEAAPPGSERLLT